MVANMLEPGEQGAEFSPERGFLPPTDPLTRLDSRFAAWEETAAELPKLLVSNRLRRRLANLPRLSIEGIDTRRSRRGPCCFCPTSAIPTSGASAPRPRPCRRRSRCRGTRWRNCFTVHRSSPTPRTRSNNWKRLDASGPVEIGNLCLLQNFWGGADEEWFVIIHVDIEMRAGAALRQLRPAQDAVARADVAALTTHLEAVRDALQGMYSVLLRMPDLCDPYIYYRRVRPYIFGWKDHPAIPNGLVYDGVDAYGDRPRRFRGETGAQSSIIPALDAVLGVRHAEDPLRAYLLEMRDYMPVEHRRFIAGVEAGP